MSFGLLGEHLSHSYSPMIHGMIGAYPYTLFEVAPQDLEKFIEEGNFSGLNVTFPYKEAVMQFVQVDPIAQSLGAVNTVYRKDGKLHGTNTDYFGFIYLLSLAKIDLTDKKVLILGTGGSSKVVQSIAKGCNASKVFVASRSSSKEYVSYNNLPLDCQIIINTTPVGTYPNSFDRIIDLEKFDKCEAVIDLTYNPYKTDFLLQGEALGIKWVNGLSMLVAQATKASQFFVGLDLLKYNPTILAKLKASTLNIVLVGMPGSGKSVIGQQLATLMGRKHVDIDKIISDEENRSISSIFREKGEKYFRELESNVIHKLAKENQLVISTGGGSVLSEANRNNLCANSILVEITRPLDMLSTNERPLLENTSLEKLFEERKDIYKKVSHITIENDDEIEVVAKKLIDKIGEFYEKDCKLK